MEIQNADPEQLTIAPLRNRHHQVFVTAFANVMSSSIVNTTYTQIVDGLPVSSVAFDVHRGCLCSTHSLL